MNNKKTVMNSMLLMTALLWGSGFVFRKMALSYMTPFFFNSMRFYIGFLFVLLIYILTTFYNKKKNKNNESKDEVAFYKPISYQIFGGVAAGAVLSLAASCQQFALSYTTAGKAGFITSLYTLFVPIISLFILKRRIKKQIWIGAVLAVLGLFLISLGAGNQFIITFGDSLVFMSAILFAVQILIIGHYITHSSALLISTAQFFSCATFSLLFSLIFETGNSMSGVLSASSILIYTGIFCIGIAYTLQTLAQKKASPSIAAIIMSLESVFAAIFGAVILGERMSGFQIGGCLLIFIAVVLAQYEKPGRIDNVVMYRCLMDEKLIAPCGMNCSLCVSYLAMKNNLNKQGFNKKYCEGCLPRGKNCTFMKGQCDLLGKGLVRFCFECKDFPCKRLETLDMRYRTKYHMSMIENLRLIKEQGREKFLENEEAKWKCSKCGEFICCHNGLCIKCDIEKLRLKKTYRWDVK